MSFPYRLHEAAHEEFIKAFEWYEFRQEGLGIRFMENVEARLEQISLHPQYYSKQYANFRAVKVEEFPYMIIYEFYPRRKLIHIAAIHHIRRHPKGRYRKLKP